MGRWILLACGLAAACSKAGPTDQSGDAQAPSPAKTALSSILSPTGLDTPVTRTVDFSSKPGATTVTASGVEVTLQPVSSQNDQIETSAAIRIAGYQSIIVSEGSASGAYSERWVAIGKLSKADPAPSVLLAGFTGGAHCCAWLKAIVPDAGKLKVVEFEQVDGEPDKTFPSDIDGDGTRDFLRQDDSFRYAFASGAGSYSPPVILNIYKGQIIDVSTQPAFQKIWKDYAKETRMGCADRSNEDRNGACAAYAAAGARLGRFDAAVAEAEEMANPQPSFGFPEGCSVPAGEAGCPPDKKLIFYNFGSALRWFLRTHKYID